MNFRSAFFAFSIAVVILLLFCPRISLAADADRIRSEAEACLKDGRTREALNLYKQIAVLSPDPDSCALAWLRIGDIYGTYWKKPEPARFAYSVVISKYGTSRYAADALFNTGMISYEQGNCPEAIRHFRSFSERYSQSERVIPARLIIDNCLKDKRAKADPDVVPGGEQIRVLILKSFKEVTLSSQGEMETVISGSRNARSVFPPGKKVRVSPADSDFKVDGAAVKSSDVVFTSKNSIITVNGVKYRGKMLVMRGGPKCVDIINVLDVEAYLQGVVPREMNGKWEVEALKAQAVVARTYALFQIEQKKNEKFDVCSTLYSQVYGGMSAEAENSNRAVQETRGMVLLDNKRPALVYYHGNSAGITEDSINVWNADSPHLRGKVDSFSLKNASSDWSCSMSLGAIRKVLTAKNIKMGTISDIQIVDTSQSGRVKNIIIRHGRGEKMLLSGNQFRTLIDPTTIKSAMFTLKRTGQTIVFEGKGSGHGVGMSQWGAYMMALDGFSFFDILKFYYPGLEIKK